MSQVAIISHDAGGAEILSSWLNRTRCDASVVVSGPAELIFKRKCSQVVFSSLDEALASCTWVLCGTGWQSNFERQAIERGRNMKKKTVAFLDHWVNYRERFEDGGRIILPDEIWVGDIDAERIARSLFDRTPVLLKSNPYVDDLRTEIACMQTNKLGSVVGKLLYVCEPVSEQALVQHGNERYWGYTEHDALHFLLTNLSVLKQSLNTITIRPHPSECINKYYWVQAISPLPLEFGGKKTLLEETLESDIIVGCESMAMVVGLLAGKRVVSAIPPGGRPSQLPHHDIEHLQQMVGNQAYYD